MGGKVFVSEVLLGETSEQPGSERGEGGSQEGLHSAPQGKSELREEPCKAGTSR